MSKENAYYTIGEISSLCDVPVKTLRYYDEIGLLVPSYRNKENNYRYYYGNQMLTLYIIKKLKSYGFSLDEIKKTVYSNDIAILGERLAEKLNEISQEIDVLRNQYTEVSALLERLQKREDIKKFFANETLRNADVIYADDIAIRIEEVPLSDCIFTRKIEKDYQNAYISIGRWFEVLDCVEKHKLKPMGAITLTYHNQVLEQFFQKDCDLEISIPVYKGLDLPEFKKFGGFKAVTAIHIGSHSKIVNTHIKVIKWINQNGYKINGLISEEFVISPIDVKNEDEYITKIIFPIE